MLNTLDAIYGKCAEGEVDDVHNFPQEALGGKIHLIKPCDCWECWYWLLPDGTRIWYRDELDPYAVAYDHFVSIEQINEFRCPECRKRLFEKVK